MIAPINFLWKQFNGPQITAICKSIYNWLKASFDTKLNYFNTFSIDTANDSHLTTIGTLMGIKRPVVSISDADAFWFTEIKETGSTQGFSDIESTTGGKFTAINPTGINASYISAEYYRPLLKTITEGKGYPGSLVLLDEICSYFYETYRPGETKSYGIYHVPDNLEVEKGYMIGDVIVYLDGTVKWKGLAFYINSVMEILNLYAYAPLPSLFPVFEKYGNDPLYFRFTVEKEQSVRGWASTEESETGGVVSQ